MSIQHLSPPHESLIAVQTGREGLNTVVVAVPIDSDQINMR